MSTEIRIGTSGWHYIHWRGSFYPEDLPAEQLLAFYAQHFDTVEINSSFYRLPTAHTVQSWHDTVPKDFCFAFKGSRFITHMKKLNNPGPAIERMLPALAGLKEKRGPVLFQLPPHWRRNTGRLRLFLEALPVELPCAFEFRDDSWRHPEIYALLKRYKAAFCIFDLAGICSPIEITADFSYVRLHGPAEAYAGSYGRKSLREWAARISGWRDLKKVYVYFDNDQAGYAVHNALTLKELLA